MRAINYKLDCIEENLKLIKRSLNNKGYHLAFETSCLMQIQCEQLVDLLEDLIFEPITEKGLVQEGVEAIFEKESDPDGL